MDFLFDKVFCSKWCPSALRLHNFLQPVTQSGLLLIFVNKCLFETAMLIRVCSVFCIVILDLNGFHRNIMTSNLFDPYRKSLLTRLLLSFHCHLMQLEEGRSGNRECIMCLKVSKRHTDSHSHSVLTWTQQDIKWS